MLEIEERSIHLMQKKKKKKKNHEIEKIARNPLKNNTENRKKSIGNQFSIEMQSRFETFCFVIFPIYGLKSVLKKEIESIDWI